MRACPCRLLLACLVLLCTACSSGDERPPVLRDGSDASAPGGWSWTRCPPGFVQQCAKVQVALNWDDPQGATIDLHVARLAAPSARTGQLWLLQGGPGGSGADLVDLIRALGNLAPHLDVYTLDHRGVGHSTRLGCPEQEATDSPGAHYISPEEFPACMEAVKSQWGQRLAHFSTTQAARDLAYLIDRTRGPHDQVFVLGCSYGTYWAIRYLQVAPEQATGVILDSIAPPAFRISGFDAQFDPVAQTLMQACEADAVCAARLGPATWSRLRSIYALADQGHCQETGFTRDTLRGVMGGLLTSWQGRLFAPALAYRFERCDPGDVRAIEHLGQALQSAESPTEKLYSDVLHHHVALSELWASPPPSTDELQQIVSSSLFAPGYGPRVGSQLARWPLYPRDSLVDQWPSTSVPLLMLNGDMDPQTPLASARVVEDHLRAAHQHFVRVRLAAHTVAVQSPMNDVEQLPCGLQMILGFLGAPTAPLDTSCLAGLKRLDFEGDGVLAESVWGVASMWDNPESRSALGRERPIRVDWDAWIRRAHRHPLRCKARQAGSATPETTRSSARRRLEAAMLRTRTSMMARRGL
ncbi:MAG: alpha/beta hydrolase [Polyangiaceae bacterium]|nr:alpha/beta hydrolase [Polyangiaceae bacterium]